MRSKKSLKKSKFKFWISVDDLLIYEPDPTDIKKLKNILNKQF